MFGLDTKEEKGREGERSGSCFPCLGSWKLEAKISERLVINPLFSFTFNFINSR